MSGRDLKIRLIMAAIGDASGPVKKLAQVASKTNRVIKEQEKAVRDLERAQRKVESFRKVRSEIAGSARSYRDARDNVARLRKEYAALDAPTRKQTAAMNAAERAADRARHTYGLQAERLRKLRGEFRESGTSSRRLGEYELLLKGKMSAATAEIKKQSDALDKLRVHQERAYKAQARAQKLRSGAGKAAAGGAVAAGVGAAVAAPFAEGISQSNSFEDAMVDLNKVANATPQQLKRIGAGFTGLSEKLPYSRAELAAIGGDLKRAGVPLGDLIKETERAAKIGIALGMAPDEAGAMVSKWRSAYKMTAREVDLTADAINEMTNAYGGDVDQIQSMVTRTGALAKAHGLVAGQVAAIAGTMNKAGVEQEVGATGIKNMMLAMGKGAAATKAQKTAWASLGLESVSMAKMMQKDAGGAILLVMDRLSKLPAYMQAAAMDQLFGSESIGAIAPLLTDLDGLRARLGLVGDESKYAGSAAREMVGELGKTSAKQKIAGNQKDNGFAALGDAIKPEWTATIGLLGKMASGLAKFAEANPGVVKFVAVLGVLIAILGGIAIAVGVVLAALASVAAVASVIGAAFTLPFIGIGLAIAAAVALVGVAIFQIVKHWDWLKAKAGEVFAAMGRFIMEGLKNGILSMLGPVGLVMGAVAKLLPDSLKQKLGIKSPSRIFAKLGGHVMEGLAVGLKRGKGAPIGQIAGTAAALTGAFGASPAMSATPTFNSPPALAAPAAPAGGMAGAAPLTINIQAAPGMNEQELARLVAAEVRKVMGGQGQARLRSFGHEPEGED